MEQQHHDNSEGKDEHTPLWGFAIFIGAAMIIQGVLGWFIYRSFTTWGERGTFGDMFGAVNTCFSGLALAGIIYAMILQREELALQRCDTRRNTEELRRAAEAEEKAATALAAQAEALRKSYAEAEKARTASVFFELFQILNAPRPKWHELYQIPSDHTRWTHLQRDLADHVGTELQRVSYVCLSGFIDPNYLMEGYAKVFVNCWQKLKPFVHAYRLSSGEPAELTPGVYQQRMHLEMFAQRCYEFLEDQNRTV